MSYLRRTWLAVQSGCVYLVGLRKEGTGSTIYMLLLINNHIKQLYHVRLFDRFAEHHHTNSRMLTPRSPQLGWPSQHGPSDAAGGLGHLLFGFFKWLSACHKWMKS